MDLATRRWRRSLALLFFLPGLGLSTWVSRTPDVRDRLDASTAEMGVLFFGLAVGSVVGVLSSGPLVRRTGTRPVVVLGTSFTAVGTFAAGGGTLVGSGLVVAVGSGALGTGIGLVEFAVNLDGIAVERVTGTPSLPAVHGCFSLGLVTGSLIGLVGTARGIPVHDHLAVVAFVVLAVLLHAVRAVPPGNGRGEQKPASSPSGFRKGHVLWSDRQFLLIGLVMLTMALAEGAANDWLPLVVVDTHGLDDTLGSLAYTVFAVAETVGRFGGGLLLRRFHWSAVLRAGAASTAVGIGLVTHFDNALTLAVAVLLWGAGASLGFPVALSAAGGSGPDAAARVGLITAFGYSAFLVGPTMLGFVGERHGLRTALTIVFGCVALASLAVPAGRDGREPGASHPREVAP